MIRDGAKDFYVRQKAIDILLSRGVRPKNYLGELEALFEWVQRHVRYTKDPHRVEVLHSPRRMLELRAGDCDDMTILLGAMLEAIGHPVRLVLTGPDPARPLLFSHIYLEALCQGRWIPLDSTMQYPMGWAPRAPVKQIVPLQEDPTHAIHGPGDASANDKHVAARSDARHRARGHPGKGSEREATLGPPPPARSPRSGHVAQGAAEAVLDQRPPGARAPQNRPADPRDTASARDSAREAGRWIHRTNGAEHAAVAAHVPRPSAPAAAAASPSPSDPDGAPGTRRSRAASDAPGSSRTPAVTDAAGTPDAAGPSGAPPAGGSRPSRRAAGALNGYVHEASELYRSFNCFDPTRLMRVAHRRVMPPVVVRLGELVGLIYSSDKWQHGQPRTYIHRLTTRPILVSDVRGRQLYVVGGRYRVTARGIEG
jgi:hypothetical protein